MDMDVRRVVVTAMGVLSPLGRNVEENFLTLSSNQSAIQKINRFSTEGFRCHLAGLIPENWWQKEKFSSKWHPASCVLSLALEEALCTDPGFVSPEMAVIGTTSGGMSFGEAFLENLSQGKVPPEAPAWVANYAAQKPVVDALSLHQWNIPVRVIANACASGTNALGYAFHMIRSGQCTRMVTGGYDMVSRMVHAGFDCLQASTEDLCRPFDVERTGLVLGEGAAVFLIESLDSALARQAPILCEIGGYGTFTDNYHLTQPNPNGIGPQKAMEMALQDANVLPGEVDYINAHGTATKFNDQSEGLAIQSLFPSTTKVSSTKGLMGHSLGAAGAIEAAFCILVLQRNFIPGNANLREQDPTIPISIVREPLMDQKSHIVLSNSFGFGGSNASIVLRQYSEEWDRPASKEKEISLIPHTSEHSASPGTNNSAPAFIGIAAAGAITSNGIGLTPLVDICLENVFPAATSLETFTGTFDAFLVPDEHLSGVSREPRLRRASKISQFSMVAVRDALDQSGQSQKELLGENCAVVMAVSSGGVCYTRKFYEKILANGASGASPLLFPETVYNAPASHVASILGLTASTYTLVGDSAVGIAALRSAGELLQIDPALDSVLVIAAEEADSITIDAYHQWRITRKTNSRYGFPLAEGAVAMVVKRHQDIQIEYPLPENLYFSQQNVLPLIQKQHAILQQSAPDIYLDSSNGTWLNHAFKTSPHSKSLSPRQHLGEGLALSGMLQAALAWKLIHSQKATSVASTVTGLAGGLDHFKLELKRGDVSTRSGISCGS